jgi:cytochrome c553
MRAWKPWTVALAGALSCAAALAGDAASHAQLNYLQHCQGCHGADGSGAPTKGIPTMRDNLGRFLQVAGGREFIVQVPGVMNTSLGDADIAELMNWLLPRVAAATVPPGTPPYSAEEIARLRRTRPADVPATRRALVQAMHARGIALD